MRRGNIKNRLLDRWVGIPVLNLAARTRPRRPMPDLHSVARLGVMCSPALGDTLLFSAVLADLRRQLPDAHIVHFCMPSNRAAAEAIVGADRRVLLDLTDPRGSRRAMRVEALDMLLDFSSWQRLTALLSWSSGARFTVGFDSEGQGRGRAYDLAVRHSREVHEVENFRAVLRALGLRAAAEPAVEIAEPAVVPFHGECNLVVLHLWASGQRARLREWPEDRWTELAARLATLPALLQEGTPLFIVTGAPSDLARMEPFAERLRRAGLRAATLPGVDGFRTLASVLRRARLVVSVNTGVMHLAAILGAPTVVLNGPNSSHRWGPVGPRTAAVDPADGSGGFLHLGFEFDGRPEDIMERMSVEQALHAAASLLEVAAPAASPDDEAHDTAPAEHLTASGSA